MQKSILVIGISEADETTTFGSAELFVKKIKPFTNSNVEFAHFNDFSFHLYGKDFKIIHERAKKDLKEYDLVFFRDWFAGGRDDLVLALSLYLEAKGVPYFNKEVSMGRSRGKLSQHVLGCIYDAPMPATFCGSMNATKDFLGSNEFFGFPCIVKASNTSRGRDNYLVNNEKELFESLEEIGDRLTLIQQFITNSRDYRVLVFEDKVLMTIERKRPESSTSHLNNTSQGAIATHVPNSTIPHDVVKKYVKICKRLGRTFTGIDIIEDESHKGNFVCLEVNNMPQMETGASVDAKLRAAASLFDALADAKS